MKKLYIVLIVFAFELATNSLRAQSTIITPGDNQTSIQTNSPNSKGITIPNLTQIQRDQTYDIPAGTIIYNSTCSCLNYYNGYQWNTLFTGSYIPIDEYAPPTPFSTKTLGWDLNLANPGTDEVNGIALVSRNTVNSNDFYVTGQAWSKSPLSQANIDGYFIAKYGTTLWERKVSGAVGYDVATDNSGNVYTIGSFTNTGNFGEGNNLTSQGGKDVFLAKYDSNGNLQWVRKAGGTGDDSGVAIGISGNDIFVTGYFSNNNFSLNSPSNNVYLNSSGGKDIFIAKYDVNGNLAWARQAGGSGDDEAKDISVGYSGITIVGYFRGTAIFGANGYFSNGGKDIFITSLNYDGSFSNTLTAGGTGDDVANGVYLNYITGSFSNSLSMPKYANGTISGTTSVASQGGKDIFLAQLINVGNGYATQFLIRGGGVNDDEGLKVALSGDNSGPYTLIGVVGNFSGRADFSGPSLVTNTNSGFVATFNVSGMYQWGKALSKNSTSSASDIAMTIYGSRVFAVGVYDPYEWSTHQYPAYMKLWYSGSY